MTIALDSNKVIYTGNEVTTVFPFSFRVDNEVDLYVYLYDVPSGVYTLLTQGVNYTVFGVPGMGSIAHAAIPATQKLIILRIVPLLQGLDINNQGGFYPEAVEAQLDTIVMGLQQLEEAVNRSLQAPYGQSGLTFPPPAPDEYIGWNAAGTALENKEVVNLGTIQVIDEDDLHSDSAEKVPTQQSVKAYADNKVGVVSITQNGAAPGSAIDDEINLTTAAAIPLGAINVPPGAYTVDDQRNDLMALGSTGNGVIRVASSGEKVNRRVVEKNGIWNYKALWYAHFRMETAGRLHILLHGDSTVEGGGWISAPFYPEEILRKDLLDAGMPAAYVSNFGKGGTTVTGLGFTDKTGWVSGVSNPALEPTGNSWLYDAATQVAGVFDPATFPIFFYKGLVDIVVVKYSVNDAAVGSVPLYINTLRAKLAELRAQFGPYMTIVVVSANVITDSYGTDLGVHNRDEAWVESVLYGERLACLDYQAAHYDVYSAFKARDPDDPFWLDSLASAGPPYRADAGVHPGNSYNAWIWGGLAWAIADPGVMAVVRRNAYRWISETNAGYSPAKASAPQDFVTFFGKEGVITVGGSDWLEAPGVETTERAPNGQVRQEEWGATSLVGRVRYGYQTSWSPDFIVGTKEANVVPGAKFTLASGSEARAVLTGRTLFIEGGLTAATGSLVTSDIACTTPAGLRPRRKVSVLFSVAGVSNIPAIWDTDGTVTLYPVASATIAAPSYCGVVATAAVG